jgi:YfiH family protein
VQVASRDALVCLALEPIAPHLMTTCSWKLGTLKVSGGNDGDAWGELAGALSAPLVRVRQVHGVAVHVRRRGDSDSGTLPAADIILSDDPAVAIAVQTADCAPILFADSRTGAVAAAHAGWRGLAAGVPRRTIAALVQEFGSRPADLIAVAGPAIGACCYEVGADVREHFEGAGWGAMAERWFFAEPKLAPRNPSMPRLRDHPRKGRWFFDVPAVVHDQLQSAGVPPERIFVADLCTASHPGSLCSYRRDGVGAGRMAAAIRASMVPDER